MNTTIEETLYQPWVIHDHDHSDYACEEHAIDYANSVDAERASAGWYVKYGPDGQLLVDIYELASFAREYIDYPAACNCGRYLDVPLTNEGRDYLETNEFPAWLKEAYHLT